MTMERNQNSSTPVQFTHQDSKRQRILEVRSDDDRSIEWVWEVPKLVEYVERQRIEMDKVWWNIDDGKVEQRSRFCFVSWYLNKTKRKKTGFRRSTKRMDYLYIWGWKPNQSKEFEPGIRYVVSNGQSFMVEVPIQDVYRNHWIDCLKWIFFFLIA